MYYKFHLQLKEGYHLPTDNRNIPSYSWLHHLLMSSFFLSFSREEWKDCYWILRTYDKDSFDVAFKLSKDTKPDDLFKRRILDQIEHFNNSEQFPGDDLDYDSLVFTKITQRDFLDTICSTEGRLMNVQAYVNRKGIQVKDFVKPLEDL